MEWLLAVVCGLICFGFRIEAQPAISVQNPIMVALAGEKLTLLFHVTVPVNQTSDTFVCRHSISKRVVYTSVISDTRNISWTLTTVNSSDSGEYYCKYKSIKAYWVVLVREVEDDTCVSRDDNAVLILNVVMNVGLFLFSCIGSTILLKDYRKQRKLRDERKEGREREGGGEGVNEGNEVATDSVYTALEHGTSSIYNVLDPSANDIDQKSVQQQVMHEPCMTQNSKKEDGIFESVYENF